jgi:hypothetical protein
VRASSRKCNSESNVSTYHRLHEGLVEREPNARGPSMKKAFQRLTISTRSTQRPSGNDSGKWPTREASCSCGILLSAR